MHKLPTVCRQNKTEIALRLYCSITSDKRERQFHEGHVKICQDMRSCGLKTKQKISPPAKPCVCIHEQGKAQLSGAGENGSKMGMRKIH